MHWRKRVPNIKGRKGSSKGNSQGVDIRNSLPPCVVSERDRCQRSKISLTPGRHDVPIPSILKQLGVERARGNCCVRRSTPSFGAQEQSARWLKRTNR